MNKTVKKNLCMWWSLTMDQILGRSKGTAHMPLITKILSVKTKKPTI